MKTDQSYDNSKDHLESFFQKRLEKNDLQYDEAQWNKMEAMLDEAKPAVPWLIGKRFFWVWTALILLLLGNGVLFYFNTKAYWGTKPQQVNASLDTSLQRSGIQPDASALDVDNPKKTIPNATALDEKQLAENQSMRAASGDQKTIITMVAPAFQQHIQGFGSSETGNTPRSVRKTIQKIVPPQSGDIHSEKRPQKMILHLPTKPMRLQALSVEHMQQAPKNLHEALVRAVHETDLKKTQNPVTTYRWALGLNYGTDLSATGLSNFSRPGNKWGATVEYMLRPKFSLQAGVQVSKIHYESTGEEYNVPYNFWNRWTAGEMPETIDATCDIIDLSIQAKYYWVNRPRSRLFASGGVSSYFLTKEFYGYNFATEISDPDIWLSHEINNENQHVFGIVNLSVGYEMTLHSRVSVQVEPFLKIPMGGVGFGNVNVFSSGANFHLRYHLGKK